MINIPASFKSKEEMQEWIDQGEYGGSIQVFQLFWKGRKIDVISCDRAFASGVQTSQLSFYTFSESGEWNLSFYHQRRMEFLQLTSDKNAIKIAALNNSTKLYELRISISAAAFLSNPQ